jgi:hypothetical protein
MATARRATPLVHFRTVVAGVERLSPGVRLALGGAGVAVAQESGEGGKFPMSRRPG